jgi:hypothetical protein
MSSRGAAAFCRSTVLLLLTLCFAWRFSTAAVSAGPGPEVSGSPDLLRVLTQGGEPVFPWQPPGSALALSDFDGDHKIDIAVGSRTGNDYAIVIHLSSRSDKTILKSTHLPANSTLFVCDINKDSFSDIVVTSPLDVHPFAVWLGDGRGSFNAAEETRFSSSPRLRSSASYNRQCYSFQQDLLSESRHLDCSKQVFAFEVLKPEAKRCIAFAPFPHLRQADQSVVGPRSPPDRLLL